MKLLNKVLVGIAGVVTTGVSVTAAVVITKKKVEAKVEERFAEQNEILNDMKDTIGECIKQNKEDVKTIESLVDTVEELNKVNGQRFMANEKMTLFMLDVLKHNGMVKTQKEAEEELKKRAEASKVKTESEEIKTDYKSEEKNIEQKGSDCKEVETAETEERKPETENVKRTTRRNKSKDDSVFGAFREDSEEKNNEESNAEDELAVALDLDGTEEHEEEDTLFDVLARKFKKRNK